MYLLYLPEDDCKNLCFFSGLETICCCFISFLTGVFLLFPAQVNKILFDQAQAGVLIFEKNANKRVCVLFAKLKLLFCHLFVQKELYLMNNFFNRCVLMMNDNFARDEMRESKQLVLINSRNWIRSELFTTFSI